MGGVGSQALKLRVRVQKQAEWLERGSSRVH